MPSGRGARCCFGGGDGRRPLGLPLEQEFRVTRRVHVILFASFSIHYFRFVFLSGRISGFGLSSKVLNSSQKSNFCD